MKFINKISNKFFIALLSLVVLSGFGFFAQTLFAQSGVKVIHLSPTTLANAQVGQNYNVPIIATSGNGAQSQGNFAFTLDGTLPAGITGEQTNPYTYLLSGTPTAQTEAVRFFLIVQDLNSSNPSERHGLSLKVVGGSGGNTATQLTITTSNSSPGQQGKSYSIRFSASGGDGVYSWDVGGATPAGLEPVSTQDNKYGFDGTPTESGYFPLDVSVSDSSGKQGSAKFLLVINQASGTKPTGTPPSGYSNNIVPPKNSTTNPTTPSGGSSAVGGIGETFTNPLGADVDTLPKFILRVIRILLTLTGMLAVLFIIIGGLRYISSVGNPEAIKGAKNTIIYAVIGLTISILSFAIIQVVTNLLVNK